MPISGKFIADFSSFNSEVAKAETQLKGFESQAQSAATSADAIGASSSTASTGVTQLATATTALAESQNLATLSTEQLDAMIAGQAVVLGTAATATDAAAVSAGAYGSVLFTAAEAEAVAGEAAVGFGLSVETAGAAITGFVATLAPWLLAIGVAVELIKKYVDAQKEATKAEAERLNKGELFRRATEEAGHAVTDLAEAEKILEAAQRHRLLLNPELAAQAYIDKLTAEGKETLRLASEESARNEGLAAMGVVVGQSINVEHLMTEARKQATEAAKEQARVQSELAKAQNAVPLQVGSIGHIDTASNVLLKDYLATIARIAEVEHQAFGASEDFMNGLAGIGDKATVSKGEIQAWYDVVKFIGPTLADAKLGVLSFGQSLVKDLKGSLSGLNGIFQAAFEGGGGVKGAIKSWGTQVIAGVTDLIPVVGPIISQFAGAITAGLSKIFGGLGGPSAAEKAGRGVVADFEKQFHGVQDEINKVGDAYATIGKSREEAQAAIKAAWDAEKAGAEATTAAVNKLNDALKRASEIDDAIGNLGIKTHDELVHAADIANAAYEKIARGVEAGQFTAEDAAKAYLAYQQALAATGDAAAAAWVKAHGAITEAEKVTNKVLDALTAKRDELNTAISQEAPEAEMGAIEKMQREQLDAVNKQIDEAQRAADASSDAQKTAAGETEKYWGDTAIHLDDALTQAGDDAAAHIQDAFDFTLHIPIVFDTPSAPGLPVVPQAGGGDWLVTKPTLFLAGEAGPERATFRPAGSSGGGAGVVVNGLNVTVQVASGDDPKQVADVVLRALREQSQLYHGIAVIADRQIAAAS